MIRNAVIASAVLCACLATAPPAGGAAGPSDGWQRVGSGVLGGGSGMRRPRGHPWATAWPTPSSYGTARALASPG
ncbi:hypothetical protein OG322_04625 [Streptomyces sp. NBC_01260]|uniref:hypothetical protein n=1 Tax=Streptomyces sp. NBC_01260 TaxID=2903801 RepID=UPI002E310279|nr:hypothetical protein [Streptomyces sp. NBC_01260]